MVAKCVSAELPAPALRIASSRRSRQANALPSQGATTACASSSVMGLKLGALSMRLIVVRIHLIRQNAARTRQQGAGIAD
jgi:hypothetical protein